MSDNISLSASDVALAKPDPFGLWHDRHGDPKLKDPEDEYAVEKGRCQVLTIDREKNSSIIV